MNELTPLQPTAEFRRACETLGISFDPGDLEKLGLYLALLLDANTRINLTAITDPHQAWMRHVFDSLTLVPYIASHQNQRSSTDSLSVSAEGHGSGMAVQIMRVIDIGSGGGLPGIPLAIALPQIDFTLLEATGKKANFLASAAQQLELRNVQVLKERAEVAGQDHKSYREQFDVVLARAVGRLPVLLELTVPFAKIGGHILAMKGEKAQEEIADSKQALHLLHAQVIDAVSTGTGTLVIIEKMRKTPRSYPRKPGEPKRAPLH